MNRIWEGNHMFIWQLEHIYSGDIRKMIDKAKELGYTGVLIKFADGSLAGDAKSRRYMERFKAAAPLFKAAGLVVGGWIYQYLTDVQGEVDACTQALEHGADWLVLDGEAEIAGKNAQVADFGQRLRSRHPQAAVGFSSFPVYEYHRDVPYREYAAFCNVMMPQVYWAAIGWDVSKTMNTTLEQYRQFGLPVAPTGQCYDAAAPADISRFIELSRRAGLDGVSWWTWQEADEAQLQATKTDAFRKGGVPLTKFPDVEAGRWSEQAIRDVSERGIMVGYADGTFRPEQPVTREELAFALARLLADKPKS